MTIKKCILPLLLKRDSFIMVIQPNAALVNLEAPRIPKNAPIGSAFNDDPGIMILSITIISEVELSNYSKSLGNDPGIFNDRKLSI